MPRIALSVRPAARSLLFVAAAVLPAGLGTMPRQAAAFEYESDLPLAGEDDVFEAYAMGLLDDDARDALLTLLRVKVDINTASRDELYQLPGITYVMADALIAARLKAGRFSARADLDQIETIPAELWPRLAPFVIFPTKLEGGEGGILPRDLAAEARLGVIWKRGFDRDGHVDEIRPDPGTYLRLRIDATQWTVHWEVGALATLSTRLSADYSPRLGALQTDGPALTPDLDQVYLKASRQDWAAILGSYRVGFGEKLTFDSTAVPRPHGFYENVDFYQDNENGDLRLARGQFGAAFTLQQLDLPVGWLSGAAFASWRSEDVYQYDMWYDTPIPCTTDGNCPDPGSTCREDGYCHSSAVYNPTGATRYSYVTLHHAYTERLLGGNIAWHLDDRTQFGLTTYAGQWYFPDSWPGGRFSFSARFPYEGKRWAGGANAAIGAGKFDLGAELAVLNNGGVGAVARVEGSPIPELDVKLIGRYYDANFDNPYARSFAEPDELDGIRARNELGVFLELIAKPIRRLRLTTRANLWAHPSDIVALTPTTKVQVYDRTFVPDTKLEQRILFNAGARNDVEVWGQYINHDLRINGYDQTYATTLDLATEYGDETSATRYSTEGKGEKFRLALQGTSNTYKPLSVTAMLLHDWQGDATLATQYDKFLRAYLTAAYAPIKETTIRARFRWCYHYTYDDILHAMQVAHPGSTVYVSDLYPPQYDLSLQVEQEIPGGFLLSVRYGVLRYNDEAKDAAGNWKRFAWYHLIKAYLEWKMP